MTTETVDRFMTVFRGRGDCYGSWQGGCIKEPLTKRQFEQHLTSGPFIGVYPLVSEHVSWGCIDIDGKDFDHDWDEMQTLAQNLTTMLEVKSVFAHIERTANGFHLWVFPEQALVPAAHMRRALMAACKAIGYDPKEVNPKQEKAVGVGNYVRLPYYGAISNGRPPNRFFVTRHGQAIELNDAIDEIENRKTTTEALAALAQLWEPPAKTHTVNINTTAVNTEELNGLEYQIWRDGPTEGFDRSGNLVKLARLLLERQVHPDKVFAFLKSADERWGKFYMRQDGDEQLARIVQRMADKINA